MRLQTEIALFELRESGSTVEDLEIALRNCVYFARLLGIADTDICAKDSLKRCPVTSAIAGGQLFAAAGLIHAFAENPDVRRKVRVTQSTCQVPPLGIGESSHKTPFSPLLVIAITS